jgi:hypothetical protein
MRSRPYGWDERRDADLRLACQPPVKLAHLGSRNRHNRCNNRTGAQPPLVVTLHVLLPEIGTNFVR